MLPLTLIFPIVTNMNVIQFTRFTYKTGAFWFSFPLHCHAVFLLHHHSMTWMAFHRTSCLLWIRRRDFLGLNLWNSLGARCFALFVHCLAGLTSPAIYQMCLSSCPVADWRFVPESSYLHCIDHLQICS